MTMIEKTHKENKELHIKEAIEVSTTPFIEKKLEQNVQAIGPHQLTELVQTPYFEVEKWDINGTLVQLNDDYFLMSIIEGKGEINDLEIQKGDHLIVTSNVEQVEMSGRFECIISRP
mgnify:CR=1 FL=1